MAVEVRADARPYAPRQREDLLRQDRNIMLTFDEGPSPSTDAQILTALAEPCVGITFFLIDRPVFGADAVADDGMPMTLEEQPKLLADRLSAAAKGIILRHGPQGRTAAVLPEFLRYLRDNRYRVVHVIPAKAAEAMADAAKNEKSE